MIGRWKTVRDHGPPPPGVYEVRLSPNGRGFNAVVKEGFISIGEREPMPLYGLCDGDQYAEVVEMGDFKWR